MPVARAWAALALTTCFLMSIACGASARAQMGAAPGAAASQLESDANTEPASTLKPDYTNRRQFVIPVELDPGALGIESLQLHSSVNRGRTWDLYAEQPSQNRKFAVMADGDGEFWFAVKTVDMNRRVRPAGETQVQRIIIVDSRKPRIELNAEPLADGKIRLRWEISDLHLDMKSLKAGYQSGSGQWQAIPLEAHNRALSEGAVAGEYDFKPQEAVRVVNLRMEVRDLANNQAAIGRQLFLPRSAKSKAAQKPTATATADPPTTTSSTNTSNQKPPVEQPPSQPAVQPGVTWPVNNQLPLPDDTVANNPNPSPTDESQKDGYGRLASQVNPQVQDQAPDVDKEITDSEDQSEPMGDEGSPDETSAQKQDLDYRWPKIPPGEPLRMTQSRRFHLDYDIEALGPDVVNEVQLWGTQDGALTWEKWNIDHDKQSPFDVQVNEEGLYGFRVVIIANNGLAGEVPSSGSPADLWVGYDATAPVAEITDVIYGSGQHLGQLDIRWTATDRRLSDRPMTLSFSTSREGPWTIIATGLPNSGQYYWEVDKTVPKQIYLRLECFDEAGNACSNVIREPVSTAGVFPRGRIRAVQPVD